jgi:hypothetical protein
MNKSLFQSDNDRHTVMQAAGCLLQAVTLLVVVVIVWLVLSMLGGLEIL